MRKTKNGLLSALGLAKGRLPRKAGDGDAASATGFTTGSQISRLTEVLGLPDPNDPASRPETNRSNAPLIIVCGLEAEARIARAPDTIVIKGGGDHRRLAADLERAAPYARGIVSFGVAGGLAPGMKPGDACVADAILAPNGQRYATDKDWSTKISAILQAPLGTFAGVDLPLGDKAGKAKVRNATGADAVDMESHVVAHAAARHGLPLAAIRVVTDPAERSLPHAATVGMGLDGRVNLSAIFRSLALSPGQIPELIRTGLDARAAFATLLRCRQSLGPRFALFDL